MKFEFWAALLQMQELINDGASPNGAAVVIANKHWGNISINPDAARQRLKRNQRQFSKDLEDYLSCKSQRQLLDFERSHPDWTVVSANARLRGRTSGSSVFPAEVKLTGWQHTRLRRR